MSLVSNEVITYLRNFFQGIGGAINGATITNGTIDVSKLNVDIATQAELDAGIGGLSSQVSAVGGTASGAQATAASNAAAIAALQSAVTALTARVATLETELDAAEARIQVLEGYFATTATDTIDVDERGVAETTGFLLDIENGIIKSITPTP